MKKFISEYAGKFDVDEKMADGWTALFYSCFNNFHELTLILLNSGADPNKMDRLIRTPLHYAARYNNI